MTGSAKLRPPPTDEATAVILLVDDDDDFRGLAHMIIDLDLGIRHEVLEVSDGYDAIRVCSEVQPDVMVLDLYLPKMSGLHVLRAVRDMPNPPCVIAWSADQFALRRAIGLGAAYGFDKGEEIQGMLPAIEGCLRQPRPCA
jgi:CheY-like chemotaxis protein